MMKKCACCLMDSSDGVELCHWCGNASWLCMAAEAPTQDGAAAAGAPVVSPEPRHGKRGR